MTERASSATPTEQPLSPSPAPPAPGPWPGNVPFQAPAPGGAYPADSYRSAQFGAGGAPPAGPWAAQPGPGWSPAPPPASAVGDNGAWIAGLVLIAIGGLLLLGRWVPDAGQYIVLAIGLVLLVVFVATREYGALVPAGIVTGVGAGIPFAAAYPGQLGGGLFLISLGVGFLLVWVLGLLFRLAEHHWWPLIPGLILGTIGGALTAGERGHGIADAVATFWPAVLVIAGVLMLAQAVRGRSA